MKLIPQLKARRLRPGLQQKDLKLRIGMNQQQYQRVEAGGNPRLETLELVAEGLEADLMLIPKDKIRAQ
ncbi:MAG: helix-turn-helix transcriptional regulator [Gammaproteobacteria bacterium]|nr:helix-turn-helix transcriptional regulator [Gammaproteobacteria bacterium]